MARVLFGQETSHNLVFVVFVPILVFALVNHVDHRRIIKVWPQVNVYRIAVHAHAADNLAVIELHPDFPALATAHATGGVFDSDRQAAPGYARLLVVIIFGLRR